MTFSTPFYVFLVNYQVVMVWFIDLPMVRLKVSFPSLPSIVISLTFPEIRKKEQGEEHITASGSVSAIITP